MKNTNITQPHLFSRFSKRLNKQSVKTLRSGVGIFFLSIIYHLSSITAHAQQWGASTYQGLNDSIGLGGSGATIDTTSLGSILGSLLPYLLTIAGLILFSMLVSGGFTMLAGAASQESQEKGKKMITSSLTGFFLIFLAYWIAQILQVIFQIDIVG